MTLHRLELEAISTAEELLKGYNAATDQWNFPREGDFWEAIRHAHKIGWRGQGRCVAIIDSGCDLTIPRLRQRTNRIRRLVESRAESGIQRHGTAVAMLLSEVAPVQESAEGAK